jgi:hypothetical protein
MTGGQRGNRRGGGLDETVDFTDENDGTEERETLWYTPV